MQTILVVPKDPHPFGIPTDHALGIAVGDLRRYARELGTNHDLALKLWSTGYYEARLLAAFVDDASQVSASQMDHWVSECDSWALCDTVCFALFDRTRHAWNKVHEWAGSSDLYTRRAAFALVWSLSVHDKAAADSAFLECLPLMEAAAGDERDHVKKGIDMALRATGKRNPRLHREAVELAARLKRSGSPSAAWIGRSSHRELTSDKVTSRLRPL